MKRKFYEEQLELHKKEVYEITDGLYDASYLLGMLCVDKDIENDDPIHLELLILASKYSSLIKREIREGKIAQDKLNKIKEAIIYEGKS